MTTEWLGRCCIDIPESCPNMATRMTPIGPLCDSHRKRTIPSREGGVSLFAPLAKPMGLRERLRTAAIDYADASDSDDDEYKRADQRLAWAAKAYAGSDEAKVLGSLEEYQSKWSKFHGRLTMEGIARARALGKRWHPGPKLSYERAAAAVKEHGGVVAAAKALGVHRRTVRRALRRGQRGAYLSPPPGGPQDTGDSEP